MMLVGRFAGLEQSVPGRGQGEGAPGRGACPFLPRPAGRAASVYEPARFLNMGYGLESRFGMSTTRIGTGSMA